MLPVTLPARHRMRHQPFGLRNSKKCTLDGRIVGEQAKTGSGRRRSGGERDAGDSGDLQRYFLRHAGEHLVAGLAAWTPNDHARSIDPAEIPVLTSVGPQRGGLAPEGSEHFTDTCQQLGFGNQHRRPRFLLLHPTQLTSNARLARSVPALYPPRRRNCKSSRHECLATGWWRLCGMKDDVTAGTATRAKVFLRSLRRVYQDDPSTGYRKC